MGVMVFCGMTFLTFLMILSSEDLLCDPDPSYCFFFLPGSFFSFGGLLDDVFSLAFHCVFSVNFLSRVMSSSFSFFISLSKFGSFEFIAHMVSRSEVFLCFAFSCFYLDAPVRGWIEGLEYLWGGSVCCLF